MEVFLEQFISSDKTKKISNRLKNIAAILFIIGIITVLGSFLIAIIVELLALLIFIGSYFMYIDYEYELYNGNITITNIYNASIRRVVQKINISDVKRVYVNEKKGVQKKGVISAYNTNIKDLKIYVFELNNNKIVELALNKEMEKMVNMFYRKKITG